MASGLNNLAWANNAFLWKPICFLMRICSTGRALLPNNPPFLQTFFFSAFLIFFKASPAPSKDPFTGFWLCLPVNYLADLDVPTFLTLAMVFLLPCRICAIFLTFFSVLVQITTASMQSYLLDTAYSDSSFFDGFDFWSVSRFSKRTRDVLTSSVCRCAGSDPWIC